MFLKLNLSQLKVNVSFYCRAFLLDCMTQYVSLSCLFLWSGHPWARLEHVCSAGGVLAELLLAEAGGRCVASGLSPCTSCHQAFLILLSPYGLIFLLHLICPELDLLSVGLILQQLLWNTTCRKNDQDFCSRVLIKLNAFLWSRQPQWVKSRYTK